MSQLVKTSDQIQQLLLNIIVSPVMDYEVVSNSDHEALHQSNVGRILLLYNLCEPHTTRKQVYNKCVVIVMSGTVRIT